MRLSPRGVLALTPGESRELGATLAEPDGCGADPGAAGFVLAGPLGAGAWPDCTGLRLTLTVRDAAGAELATGERTCTFDGRAVPLRLDPDALYGR